VERFAYSGKWPPDPEDVDGTIEALGMGPIWELICAGCGDGSIDIPPTEVTMGGRAARPDAAPGSVTQPQNGLRGGEARK